MPPTFVLSQDQTLQKFLLTALRRLFFEFNLPLSGVTQKLDQSDQSRTPVAYAPGSPSGRLGPGLSHAEFRRKPNPLKASSLPTCQRPTGSSPFGPFQVLPH